MPWKEATKVDERRRMIWLYQSRLYGKSELAELFGVTRPTLNLWIARYEELGEEGLIDRAPIPKDCPHRTDPEIAERLIEAKKQKSHWGPVKILAWMSEQAPSTRWPAPSTVGDLYDREGLVRKRKKRRQRGIAAGSRKLVEPTESGQMMTADHKGQFRLGNTELCYPLTINDPVSRYSYAIEALDSTSISKARPVFERVFRDHGLPLFIKTDNGSPFCSSAALGGLTRLSAWWIKLGITPVRIRKGSPWQNGAHERMHRTLKAETTRPPAADMQAQQQVFERFQQEYNLERPHESLNGKAPQTALRGSGRPYPERLPEVEYDGHMEVRRVRSDGRIKWRGDFLFVSEALIGDPVGLEEIDDGVWSLRFVSLELARYDARTKKLF